MIASRKRVVVVSLVFFCVMCSTTALAETYYVNCNLPGPMGKISTVLKRINTVGPNTINVKGSCKENLSISGLDHLSLITTSGATLKDASNSQSPVIDVEGSREFVLQGFTVSGGLVGLQCSFYSTCHSTVNTYTGGVVADAVFNQAKGILVGDSFVNSLGIGLALRGSSSVSAWDITVENNQGSGIDSDASHFEGDTVHVLNNTGNGVYASHQSYFTITNSDVSNNSNNGIDIEAGSVAYLAPGVTVTGNLYIGVVTVDGSVTDFLQQGTFTGNQWDIACGGQYPVLRYLQGATYNTIANCPDLQQSAARPLVKK